jgi:RNA polymerase sigma-70 factor (sigma-E family)
MDQLTETHVPPGGPPGPGDPAAQVAALYAEHGLGLLRLAVVLLGDRQAAEDVVQEAFLGLHRRWGKLRDADRAHAYVRSAVFNGCRSVLRKRVKDRQFVLTEPDTESAETRVLLSEEHAQVLAAMRRLPDRQREAVALRYCLDMSPAEVATEMGISQGTVKSATSRGLAALRKLLEGTS